MITFNIHLLTYAFRPPWDLFKEKFVKHKYTVTIDTLENDVALT